MGTELSQRASDWIIIVSLAAGTLVVLARFFNAQRVPDFLKFPWQSRADEFAISFSAGKLALNADRILILSAWIFFPVLVTALKMEGDANLIIQYDWASYFRILLLGGLYLILKLLVASAVGYAFEREEDLWQGQNLALAHFSWLSLGGGLLAFVFHFLPASPLYFYILLVLFILLALLFLFRVLSFCLRQGFSPSYIFLYICALEIIPLVYLYNLV